MSRSLPKAALAVSVLLFGAGTIAAQPHVDHEGNPLPVEAIARVAAGRMSVPGGAQLLSYSPDGSMIVGVTFDDAIRLWDAKTGALCAKLPVHHVNWGSLAWGSAGKSLAFYGTQGFITLDGVTGRAIRRLVISPQFSYQASALSRDTTRLAIVSYPGTVRVIETAEGNELWRKEFKEAEVHAVEFTADGKTLHVLNANGIVSLIDANKGTCRRELKTSFAAALRMRISPDGTRLFLTASNESGRVFDLESAKEISRLGGEAGHEFAEDSAFSPDGQLLLVSTRKRRSPGEGHLAIFDVASGREVWCNWVLPGACAFAPDGKRVAVATFGGIRQYDARKGELLHPSVCTLAGSRVVRFLGGKAILLQGDGIFVWDWQAGRLVRHSPTPRGGLFGLQEISPDGELAAVDGWPDLQLRETRSWQVRQRFVMADGVGTACFAPDGKSIYTLGTDNMVRVRDVATGKTMRTWHCAKERAWLVGVSPGGEWLAAGVCSEANPGVDEEFRFWDAATGRLVSTTAPLPGARNVLVFSPDETTFALTTYSQRAEVTPRQLAIGDIATGRLRRRFAAPLNRSHLELLAFSPDGRTLASPGRDGAVDLWEVETGQRRHLFLGHGLLIGRFAFSPDGGLLATSCTETPALVWDVYGARSLTRGREPPWAGSEGAMCWEGLASPEAHVGFGIVRRLVRNPRQAVALLRERLRPIGKLDAKEVQRLIAQLGDDDFDARQNAAAALERYADRVEVPLRQVIASKAPLEARRRALALLEKLEAITPERVRYVRALEVLEQIATPDAVALLDTLAAGDPAARLTREAPAARERLRKW